MSVLKRVNVIGNEIHGSRYRDAALFYPGVETVAFNEPDFSAYDTVVFAEPYLCERSLLDTLVSNDFDGLLILEKMQFRSHSAFAQFCQNEYPFDVIHSMLRLFEDKVLDIKTNHLTILWPNLVVNHMSQTYHTLPNALLFCRTQLKMGVDCIKSYKWIDTSLLVELANERYTVDLKIINTNDVKACVIVNEKPIQWPSYMTLIHRLFDAIIMDNDDERLNPGIIGELTTVLETIENKEGLITNNR